MDLHGQLASIRMIPGRVRGSRRSLARRGIWLASAVRGLRVMGWVAGDPQCFAEGDPVGVVAAVAYGFEHEDADGVGATHQINEITRPGTVERQTFR